MWRGIVVIHYHIHLQYSLLDVHHPWICLVKNLTSKIQWNKTWTKEEKVHIHMYLVSIWHSLIKSLLRKIQWDKNLDEGKIVQCVDLLMTRSPWWDKLHFQHVTSLRRRITILCTSFLNVDVGNAFVNKSVRLSLDRICWISTLPLF